MSIKVTSSMPVGVPASTCLLALMTDVTGMREDLNMQGNEYTICLSKHNPCTPSFAQSDPQ